MKYLINQDRDYGLWMSVGSFGGRKNTAKSKEQYNMTQTKSLFSNKTTILLIKS